MSMLSEFAIFSNGKKRPKREGEYPVYGGNGILGSACDYNMENGIVVGRVGAYCGSVHLERGKCWVSDNAIKVEQTERSNLAFLYYLLKYLKLNERRIGTSQPLLTQGILNSIEVNVPDIHIQEKIAEILEGFDKKIQLNTEINENLEQQAATYFYHQFIANADPSWREGTISDLGTVIGGSTPSKKKSEYYTDNGIAWITPKDLSVDKSKFISHGADDITELGLKNSSASIMPTGTVLFSSRAPIGYITVADGEVTTNQGFKSVVPHSNVGTAFVYYFLKNALPTIENMASGSTFKEVSGSAMRTVPAIIPDDESLQEFADFCEPLFQQQRTLEAENRSLTSLRDSLLPKLMSGELDVSDLNF